jgi:DNA topoisomerase-1
VKQNFIGVKCPDCKDGELVEKRARKRGTTFYGCSNYPKCKFTSAQRPIAETCPKCGHEYLVQKYTPEGFAIACPKSGCDYSRPTDAPDDKPQQAAS